MNENNWTGKNAVACLVEARAVSDCCLTLPASACSNIKISKQSALAVIQYLRDNQHQSPGRPRFALA